MRYESFLFAIALALGAAACSSKSDAGSSSGCSSTSQCKLGDVCYVPNKQCVPEPTDGLMGLFECTLDVTSTGKSEVVGSFAGQRYLLTTAAICNSTSNVVVFQNQSVTSQGTDGGTLTLVVENALVAPGGPVSLQNNTSTQPLTALDSGTLWIGSGQILALVESGQVWFNQVPQSGSTISGFLDVQLRAPGGAPPACNDGTSGAADCASCLSAAQNAGGCCADQDAACVADADCHALLGCENACADSTCMDGCTQQYPNGVALLSTLLDCLVGSASAGSVGACGNICA